MILWPLLFALIFLFHPVLGGFLACMFFLLMLLKASLADK
jgi:hypothetical protein